MATPLDVSNRRQGAEYHNEVVVPLEGVNLDANDATLGKGEMRQLLNYRLGTVGNLEVRSGYVEYDAGFTTPIEGAGNVNDPGIPIAQMEFVAVVSNTNPATQQELQGTFNYTVTAVWKKVSGFVVLHIVDKDGTNGTPIQSFVVTNFHPTSWLPRFGKQPMCDMCEYQDAIIIALYDDPQGADPNNPHPDSGVYQLFPNYDPAIVVRGTTQPNPPVTQAVTWTANRLGKGITPTPVGYTFEQTVKGPLMVLGEQSFNDVSIGNVLAPKFVTDPLTNQPQVIPLNIDCPYALSGTEVGKDSTGRTVTGYMKERLFVQNASENIEQAGHIDKSLPYHPPARAWGYRARVRFRQLDPRGNPFEIIYNASTDWWVQNNEYVPPVLGDRDFDANGKVQLVHKIFGWKQPPFDVGGVAPFGTRLDDHWRDDDVFGGRFDVANAANNFFADLDNNAAEGLSWAQGYPDNQTYLSLRNLFRDAIAKGIANTDDPYAFVAQWLGWWKGDDAAMPDNNSYPYMTAVPASQLKGAPLTVFTWKNFGLAAPVAQADGTFVGAYQIDIYRTAHTEPNEKDNTALANSTSGSVLQGDLLFQPNLYGYIGTLNYDDQDPNFGSFTDEIADTAIDFGQTPDDAQGFIVGQFTGTVLRVYNQKLVLGNLRTTYWVDTPWQLPVPFVNTYAVPIAGLGNYDPNTQFIPSGDTGLDGFKFNVISWCYTYVDNLGNASAPIDFKVDAAQTQGITGTDVTFVFPRGYDPSIVKIRLYESRWDPVGLKRGYFLVGTFATSLNMTERSGPRFATGAEYVQQRPVRSVKDYWGPGNIMWTDLNNPFSWPETNLEVHSETFPITAMDDLLGKLTVFTTHTVTITQADELIPRFEILSSDVGCIAPKCSAKYGQVVFMLSEKGVQFAQPSGVIQYPAKVYAAILEYLVEEIPGLPKLSNASRASMGINERKQELWIYFPSSLDLYMSDAATQAGAVWANALPQQIFVYKFIDGEIGSYYRNTDIRNVQNYTFDLHKDFQLVNATDLGADLSIIDVGKFRSEKVWFSSHSDNSLWCTYYDTVKGELVVLDCDREDVPWPGYAALEKPIGVGLPHSQKQMRQIAFKGVVDSALTIYTGIRKKSGLVDVLRGSLDGRVKGWPVTQASPNSRPWLYAHQVTSLALESMGDDWAMRLFSRPSPHSGNHTVSLESIDAFMSLKHHHPG